MELKELVREIHWTEWQLRTFEDRYGVRSEDFYVDALDLGASEHRLTDQVVFRWPNC